jgi:hypothetical protein
LPLFTNFDMGSSSDILGEIKGRITLPAAAAFVQRSAPTLSLALELALHAMR